MSATTENALTALVSLVAKGIESGRLVIEVRINGATESTDESDEIANAIVNAQPRKKRGRR